MWTTQNCNETNKNDFPFRSIKYVTPTVYGQRSQFGPLKVPNQIFVFYCYIKNVAWQVPSYPLT